MTAIDFKNVSKSFKTGFKRKRIPVLHGLTLQVQKGEIFGFLGPNGAGKSTSIKLLHNFIRPDQGRIKVCGADTRRERFQHHIGYLPETPCFYENLTGSETLWFGGRASGMAKEKVVERTLQVLERLNLSHAGNNAVRTYSKGMKQRLGLAMALIHDPVIYVLDEPMSGLDPMGRRLVADVILELKDKGKTVFFSSHILSDIERLCDRIGIIHKGRLLYCGQVAALMKEHTLMEDAFISFIKAGEKRAHE